jgi:hypothetical protein
MKAMDCLVCVCVCEILIHLHVSLHGTHTQNAAYTLRDCMDVDFMDSE